MHSGGNICVSFLNTHIEMRKQTACGLVFLGPRQNNPNGKLGWRTNSLAYVADELLVSKT